MSAKACNRDNTRRAVALSTPPAVREYTGVVDVDLGFEPLPWVPWWLAWAVRVSFPARAIFRFMRRQSLG